MQQVLLIFTYPLGFNTFFCTDLRLSTQILPRADVKIETEDLALVWLDPEIIGEGVASSPEITALWERAVLQLWEKNLI